MNKYIFIALALILIFFGQPRRSSDPLGALVITAAIGMILLVIALLMDFVLRPLRRKIQRRQYPALCIAAEDGKVGRVVELVSAGASPNAAAPSGETPLMLAARNGHLMVVDALLQAGADPSMCTAKGSTAQAIALNFGHKEVAERLRRARE